jgi:single-strand selective monofunctional uracil DNA glycosylase
MSDKLTQITDNLISALAPLEFSDPVTHVYNPLEYAREPHLRYVRRYAGKNREAIFLGMNPGPFGMAQTGVPFGEVALVRDWMGVSGKVGKPPNEHPKRPIQGFDCPRSEVSGARLWGWARDRFGTPEAFFERFFVVNYCPLVFMEESGRNRTPDKLAADERASLYAACDDALRRLVDLLQPRRVIGVGQFAEKRAREVLEGIDVPIGRILHPSPASPAANRDWAGAVVRGRDEMGIAL